MAHEIRSEDAYTAAIIALRKMVEQDGTPLDEALTFITTQHRPGLGLNQAAQLASEARLHYAAKRDMDNAVAISNAMFGGAK
jgi:hypothetical protein